MITNTIYNKIISKKEKHCKNIFTKGLGMMFSKKKTIVMYFNKEQIISLHNFFVFFPINLYFLDKNMKVIEIKKRFLPFTFYTSKNKAKYLVESPFDLNTDVGDILDIRKIRQ